MTAAFTVSGPTLKSIREVVESVKLQQFAVTIQGDLASIIAVDAAHVAFVQANFAIVGGPVEPVDILLDLDKYKDAIKGFVGEDVVSLEVANGRLTFKKGRKKRILGMLDPRTTPKPNAPTLRYERAFVVPKAFLASCMKNSPTGQTDSVLLQVKDGLFTWLVSNDIVTDMFEDSTEVAGAEGVSEQTFFSHAYLVDALDPAVSQEVSIYLRTAYPLRIDYALNGGTATVLLAPRVEGEVAKDEPDDESASAEDPDLG